ncbi:hypothetical protein ACWC10_36805 [Streptomyces sp. NPDC001595]|uniref:hypothetical protein n=1 Tax=Streptomyces sp. NPDC001532 TaxID=3154520 RepID=UPI003330332A
MSVQEKPVVLGEPTEPPEPLPDCDICQALVRQRDEATARGDHSRATDFTVEIRGAGDGDAASPAAVHEYVRAGP